MDRDSFVTDDRQVTHRSDGKSDSPVTDRHSRASLRSGLTFLVSSGLPRFPDFFVTFRILSLGAASLIQSLPGGYIPRVEKERGIRHVIAIQGRVCQPETVTRVPGF